MTSVILTCEHAGNRVPAAYVSLFRGARRVLESHRGWDPGSLAVARAFQRRLKAPLFFTNVSRLVVEANRSVGHRKLFSEFTAGLDNAAKQTLLDRYYYPHRKRVESWIAGQTDAGQAVVHLSLHTFTPELNGILRNADFGLLYDPGRPIEKELSGRWLAALKQVRPELRLRRNYPYLGKADGFTTHLRRRFPASQYAAVELEVNQRWPATNAASWRRLQRDLADSFEAAIRVVETNRRR